MSDAAVVTPPAATPPADTPPGTPPASESLLPPLTPPSDPPVGSGDDLAWLPEKYRVNGADGKLDLSASSKKLSDGYANLSKRLGTDSMPPAAPTDYTFTPPEEFKDMKLDDAMSAGFRERAHKAGFSQAQYEMVMGEYLSLVPQVLDSVVKASAEEAKAELSKVWQSPAVFEAQVNNVMRSIATSGLAPDLQQEIHARFGRDPLFLQYAAAMGQDRREDRAPVNPDGGAHTPQTMSELQSSEAYRNPKHPDHAKVSAQVNAIAQKITPG